MALLLKQVYFLPNGHWNLPYHILACSLWILYTLTALYTLYISNCSQLTAPLSVLQHPRGLSEALCQKCNSDLCCCFSCFCAGPERAVHTAGDGSPSTRQPDPSHREKRYIRVNRPTHSSAVCLASPSFRLCATVSLLPSASRSHASIFRKCRRWAII